MARRTATVSVVLLALAVLAASLASLLALQASPTPVLAADDDPAGVCLWLRPVDPDNEYCLWLTRQL